MKIIAFITDSSLVGLIINHQKLRFSADKSPPHQIASQEVLVAAETGSKYFL
jgi:hypothetical protein